MSTELLEQSGKEFFADHLAHFSGARTNPYAIQIAAQICKDFTLSVGGQRRLNKALNDLPCVDAVDPKLSFAWSEEHIIRSPRVHRFGYEHLTLVITLAECFHETYAAEVFHHLAKKTLNSEQNTPHIYQWVDLLHFANGILATDDFSLMVENFILLDPYSITPGSKYSVDRCLVPPDSFATALLALSELISGKRVALTLRGGGVVGWIAALAEAFYGLTVTIESRSGDHLHGPKGGAMLNLIYTEKPELVLQDAEVEELTKEVTAISLSPFSKQIHFMPFGGRIAWRTLLQQVFGESYHRLEHDHSKTMYTIIGTAFRAIEGAKDSTSISIKQGPHASLANQAVDIHPQNVTNTLVTYLSSLQRGAAKIEKHFKLSPQEAAKTHLDQIFYLARECNCVTCHSAVGDKPQPDSTGRDATAPNASNAGYCLPAIVSTIVSLALLLSRIVLDRPIDPSREGVQLLYKIRTDRFTKTADHNMDHATPNHIATLYDNIPSGPTGLVCRMAVKLFAGGHLPPLGSDLLPNECVAIAHEGVCAYAAELSSGKNVRKDMRGMIKVVNGAFGIRQKTYRLAAWAQTKPGGREGWQWEEVEVNHLKGLSGGRLWMK